MLCQNKCRRATCGTERGTLIWIALMADKYINIIELNPGTRFCQHNRICSEAGNKSSQTVSLLMNTS